MNEQLQKELAEVNDGIEAINSQPPTMDCISDWIETTKRYQDLQTRKAEIETLLSKTA